MNIVSSVIELLTGKPCAENPLIKVLDSMPEPPDEFKALVGRYLKSEVKLEEVMKEGTRLAKTTPCPFCHKVHGEVEQNNPQVTGYEFSDGNAGSYEFTPRSIRSIQLLPNNFRTVMAFMYENSLSFAYCASEDSPHFHVKDENGETDKLILENDYSDPAFEVYIWTDGYFRTQLRPKSPETANLQFPVSFEKDYRDDPIQTAGHSMQADLDAEQESEL